MLTLVAALIAGWSAPPATPNEGGSSLVQPPPPPPPPPPPDPPPPSEPPPPAPPPAESPSPKPDRPPFVSERLLQAAKERPGGLFEVIVSGKDGVSAAAVTRLVESARRANPGKGDGVERRFGVIDAVLAEVTGRQLLELAREMPVEAIVRNAAVAMNELSNRQLWPVAAGIPTLWRSASLTPAIAIVDSGVDGTRVADFGARVIRAERFVSRGRNSAGDGRGHGTFVASIAAGAASGYAGVAPRSPIVSLDVFDDRGAGVVADVIAAADWIHRNRHRYGIRIANFSLTGSQPSSLAFDPLNAAVEALWLDGVVVVCAAGNYAADGRPSGVLYPPGNDPFVITMGAADINGTAAAGDDEAAPWSAYGYTPDGFRKPELGAPGRYMTAAVPTGSTMYRQHPERIVRPGYMWMSGTSFAAPVVSGAAAQILGVHPDWTPDQVKGALMLTAQPYAGAEHSLGVGTIDVAAALAVAEPPNPNLGLEPYVVARADGSRAFDAARWSSDAEAGASWWAPTWSSVSWNSASWSSASWSSASWTSGSGPGGSLPAAASPTLTWVE